MLVKAYSSSPRPSLSPLIGWLGCELMITKPKNRTASTSGSDSAPVLPVAESPSELASMPAKSGTRLRGGKDAGESKSVEEAAIVAKMYIEPVFDKGTSDAEDGSSCSSSNSNSSGFVIFGSNSSGPRLRSRASDCNGQRVSFVISI